MDNAVVHEHHVPHGDIVNEPLVVDVDGMHVLAAFAAHGEFEDVAGPKIEFCFSGRRFGSRAPECRGEFPS